MSQLQVGHGGLTQLFKDPPTGDALVLSQLEDAIIIADAETRIVYANPAFERMLGWKVAEVVGWPVTFRFPPEVQAEVYGRLARVVCGETYSGEREDYRADGSRVWIHWRAKRIVDAAGHVLGTMIQGTDISDRKRAETEREQLQQQLYQAQRLDTLGTLAGGIAHDFNNILAVILGFTELALARGGPDDATRHMHQQVLTASRRGRELVNRILSFSRFHQPERRPTALTDVVGEASKFIRATLPSTIELETDFPPTCEPALVDANQIHQVLLNLATNAAHAMRDQHGTFALRLDATVLANATDVATGQLAAGKYLVISATDTGTGMEPAVRQRIFDPFFSTKKEGEGTGLGLSVARAIIQAHGGQIDVESTVGRGTTFRIHVPVASGVVLPAVTTDEPITPRLRARGETIAIIDDEEAMVSVTERVLQSFGYATLTFRSAEKFHAMYLTAPTGIDLLVTDQTMPGITGMELVRRLREAGHQLPVLLMTGFSKQLRPEIVAQFGHSTLLRKPFDRADLGRTVRELLDARPAGSGDRR